MLGMELVILVWAGVSLCAAHYIATNRGLFRELYNDIKEEL